MRDLVPSERDLAEIPDEALAAADPDEAARLAWEPLGWQLVWSMEVPDAHPYLARTLLWKRADGHGWAACPMWTGAHPDYHARNLAPASGSWEAQSPAQRRVLITWPLTGALLSEDLHTLIVRAERSAEVFTDSQPGRGSCHYQDLCTMLARLPNTVEPTADGARVLAALNPTLMQA